MSHEQTRQRVLDSLFAPTGNNRPRPLSHHMTEVEFLRVAVRWFVAIQRDREENGPLTLVNAPESREAA